MEKKEKKITYPRMWGFRVIGEDKEKIRQAIKECIHNQECKVEDSKSNGKFHSQKFEAFVASEEERNEFFKRLQEHEHIKFVL